MNLFTPAWWESAGARAANGAISAVLPAVALLFARDVGPLYVLNVAAVAALLSFATSLFGLPEVTGKTVPLWRAVLVRTAKQLGQTLGAALAGVVLLTDVSWEVVGYNVAGAVVFTALRTLKEYLPEQEPTGDTGVDADEVRVETLPSGVIRVFKGDALVGQHQLPDDGPRHLAD